MTEEARLAFLYRSQGAVLTITVAVRVHCLGSTTYTEDLSELWSELKSRYTETAESTVDALFTESHLVSRQVRESVTQYKYCIGMFQKQLSSAGNNFDEEICIRTMLRGLPTKFSMTRDLIMKLSKNNHKATAMLMEKGEELRASEPQLAVRGLT